MQSNSQRWLKWHFSLWIVFLFALIGFSAFRFAYLYLLGPEISSLPSNELVSAFWIGFRFDLKHLAISLSLLTLVSLPFYWASSRFWSYFKNFTLGYQFLIILFINLLGIVNYYFFSFYQSPINALIFGLNEDDTNAVLITLWSDFPVVRLLALLFIISFLQIYLAFKLGSRLKWQLKAPKLLTLILISTLFLAFMSRGSFGTFPLRGMHTSVSSNSFINQLVPSGLHALYISQQRAQIH